MSTKELLKYFTLPNPYNYIKKIQEDKDGKEYFLMGVERGERSMPIRDEWGFIHPSTTGYLVIEAFEQGLRYDVLDELPKYIEKMRWGDFEEYGCCDIWHMIMADLHEKINFRYDFRSDGSWTSDEEYCWIDPGDVDAEEEKIKQTIIYTDEFGVDYIYVIRFDYDTKLDISTSKPSDGFIVCVSPKGHIIYNTEKITFFHDNENCTELRGMDEHFIEIDKKIKEHYPGTTVSPISQRYYMCESENGVIKYLRVGQDESIYEIKEAMNIEFIKEYLQSIFHQHIIKVIKFRCQNYHGYTLGGYAGK